MVNKQFLMRLGLGTAVACIILGLVTLLGFQHIFDHMISKEMVLKEGTNVYQAWKDSQMPSYMKVYFFTVLNPKSVTENGTKPMLKELGPYVFRETNEKVDVQPHPENGTISYKKKRHWFFKPALSSGLLSDHVVTPNFPLMMALEVSETMSSFVRWGMLSIVSEMGLEPFVNQTVGELLFDGYEDPILSMGNMFASPKVDIPLDKFGWFYKRNGTTWADGTFTTFTGETHWEQFGKISSWNHQNRSYYKGECGKMYGSAEGFYPPLRKLKDASETNRFPSQLDLYSHESCRALPFLRMGEDFVDRNGVKGLDYWMDENVFANESVHSFNACFENNLRSGLQNISLCKSQGGLASPIFLSLPHYYAADSFYLQQFAQGSEISPDRHLHLPRIVLEPTLSVPLELRFRLQLNLRLRQTNNVRSMMKLPEELYFPCLWFEAEMVLDEEMSSQVGWVVRLPEAAKIVTGIWLACGLLLLLSVAMIRKSTMNSAKNEITVTEVDEAPEMGKFIQRAPAPNQSLNATTVMN